MTEPNEWSKEDLTLSTLDRGDIIIFTGGDGEFEFRVGAELPGGPAGSLIEPNGGHTGENDAFRLVQLLGAVPYPGRTNRSFCAALEPGLLKAGHVGSLLFLVTNAEGVGVPLTIDCENFGVDRTYEQ